MERLEEKKPEGAFNEARALCAGSFQLRLGRIADGQTLQ